MLFVAAASKEQDTVSLMPFFQLQCPETPPSYSPDGCVGKVLSLLKYKRSFYVQVVRKRL